MSRERDRNRSKSSRHHDYLIKLRGFPSKSDKDDIKKFLYPCRIVNIYLYNNKNNNNNDNALNECYVDLESENDVKDALKKTNLTMGSRYVELYRANIYEFNFFIKHKDRLPWCDPVLRMFGLPYTCTMADVQLFFKDIEIARNGIYISRDMSDNAVGVGFVAFVSMDNAYKAIDIYDQKKIERRYIELTPSSYDKAKKTITDDAYLNGKRFAGEDDDEDKNKNKIKQNNERRNRSRSKQRLRSTSRDRRYRSDKRRRSSSNSPRTRSRPQLKTTNQHSRDDRKRRRSRSRSPLRHRSPVLNQNGEYMIKMRGMPYTVNENDIREFFPSTCQPVRMEILQDPRTNRPNGDGHVYFKSKEEILEAIKCDRKYMGFRYVELYFDAPPPSSSNSRRSKSNDHSRYSSLESTNNNNKTNDNNSRSGSESQH